MRFDRDQFLHSGTMIAIDREKLLLGWGKRNWSTDPQSSDQPNFYFPDFFLKMGCPWFTQENWAVMKRDELDFSQFAHDCRMDWTCSDKENFSRAFADLQAQFKSGTLLKAVPYIFERAHTAMSENRLGGLLRNVLSYSAHYPAHVYGMWNQEEGVLGATPELLFDYGPTVKSVACAGTYRIGEQTTIDEDKTRTKHELVVEGIKRALEPFGTVQVGPRHCEEFGAIGHFMTPLELHPSGSIDFLRIVRALHPTPALGAYPRAAGMRWLESYQMRVARGRFGTPVGYMHEGKGRCVVAIRNVQWKASEMRIGAGCGVVAASRFEEEWNELQLKLNAIKELLGIC